MLKASAQKWNSREAWAKKAKAWSKLYAYVFFSQAHFVDLYEGMKNGDGYQVFDTTE